MILKITLISETKAARLCKANVLTFCKYILPLEKNKGKIGNSNTKITMVVAIEMFIL
jgi:hypothetical protein